MTTIAEEVKNREQELKDSPSMIINIREKVIQAVELANEMKSETGIGLNSPYPFISEFYGKQRALLRGLTSGDLPSSDILKFNLPSTTQWNEASTFTFPSNTQWGYEFYDLDENISTISNPELHYLAKVTVGNIPCTVEKQMGAFLSPVVLQDFKEIVARGDGSTTEFSLDLSSVAVPSTIQILHDDIQIGQDNGFGVLYGTNIINSTVDYETNKVILEYSAAIEKPVIISLKYDSYINESDFTDTYSKFDFTLATKNYGSGLILNLINVVAGTLDEGQRPCLLETMIVRKKADHQPIGTIQVVCEGLETNQAWEPLLDDAEEATLLDHAGFTTLLGYLDPSHTDDVTKSANSYIASSGRSVGATEPYSYPDIEASPFFPATDGEYFAASPFLGYWVHWEKNSYKWSVHSDIKWQYGTAPENDGDTVQYDPGTMLSELNELVDFSSSNPTIIPDDYTEFLVSYVFLMSGDYVVVTTTSPNSSPPPDFIENTDEYTCYYNDVQHLKDNYLDSLSNRCQSIIDLEDVSNTIDGSRDQIDTDFYDDTIAFKTALDSFASNHDSFNAISSRPTTYVTSYISALIIAAGVYLTKHNSRVSDLNSILGSPTVEGSYSKIIYDSCNTAVNKDIGYVSSVRDKLNSIQDIYDLITQKQNEYTMFPK